jgi:transcriptional regulator with XRE-family HTH domain
MGRHQRSEFDRLLGHRIMELRRLAGMTQNQLAQRLGVSTQQVHKFEKGTDQVSAGQLFVIARSVNVAVANLFDGYEDGAPLDPLGDPRASRMLLKVTRSFLELEPKYQDALVRLARAMAEEGSPFGQAKTAGEQV